MEELEKALLKDLETFHYSKSVIDVFKDCIEHLALQTAIAVDKRKLKERTEQFEHIFDNYSTEEKENAKKVIKDISQILCQFQNGYDDYLGKVYMKIVDSYGKKSLSQFFTPYHISKLMADMTLDEQIESNKNLITINDPCCGAGAMCIAAIDVLNENKVDYLNHALIYANDIDKTCVYMTYLQLSFAGAAAIVEHKDTLMQETYDTFRTLGYIVQQAQNKNQM